MSSSFGQAPTLPMSDDNFLRMPVVGDHSLRLLNSNVVEVMMVTAKDPDPAPLTSWNFLDATGNGTLPAASSFTVSANGSAIPVTAVGFKRRVLYAPLRVRDLRIANWLYLQLASPIPGGAVVTVVNPPATLWSSSVIFSATNAPQRYSPSLHVNQAGYISNQSKKAMVGHYLGTLGELAIPSGNGFQLVNAQSGATAFTGSLTRRPDVGYSYSPTPYQQVYEADFTSFTTPGEYKLYVPGLGVSFPFYIDDGMAGTYARTYALGIYHQRCGTSNSFPYTRHTHGACHTNLVMIPSAAGPEQDFVNYVLNNESAGAVNNPRHTAPRMVNVAASRYPFINTAPFDARGGHHDAGDYSKYTTSVSLFVHNLIFAVDSLPGVRDLDNLGLPESGDGISDIMQEAKWEADYLAKLQDADGGFYFIIYPRTRQYELDSLPEQGDAQLVLPKNTSATAAAVGALADMASSPTFKATYPAAASNYLAKAIKGWQFLQNAIATYGKDGAYQMITFSADTFMHDDELAWAAAALYNATGDPAYRTALYSYMPNPNSQSLRRWAWWSMFGGYGCATRDYGFAVRSGKLTSGQVDASYLAQCEAEIKFAGSNSVDWSAKMAYGSSFTDESKGLRVAGWYFSGEWTLDPAAAYVVDASTSMKSLYLDCILKNFNYEMGCNPVNVTYLTGLGTRRQREIVHQYALNDRRVLPPAGIPLGNIQAQYDYLQLYKTELSSLSYPLDDSPGNPFAYYDRWADTFNVSTEFVVSQTAKTLPAAAMMMAMSPVKTQVWNSATAQIVNLPVSTIANQPVNPSLASSVDLSKARILWESGNNISCQEPFIGPSHSIIAGNAGVQWIEAEAQLPDGRRIVVVTNFTAIMAATNTIELYQPIALEQNTNVIAWYKLDGSYADAMGRQPSFTPGGNASLDNGSFAWANRPNGAAVRVLDLGDKVTVAIPNAQLSSGAGTTALSMEGMIYVNRQVAYGRGNANLFTLTKGWNAEIALRHNIWTAGPALTGGATVIADHVALANYLKTGQWQHFKVRLSNTGYTLAIDGQTVASVASTDLANWGGTGNAALEIGSFDGWLDEIVLKNEGGSVVSNPPPVSGAAVVSVSATAAANEAGLVAGTFLFTRDTTAATNLTVNLSVSGTATSGTDYAALPATVTIAAGSTTATLSVTPIQDATYEGNETVTVTLAAGAGYTIATGTANLTVVDDDPDSRPPPPGQTNYVTIATALNTNVVALYHFDGNLADASGRQPSLTLGGFSALDPSNLNWMSSPSGSGLRVLDLGDNATVTLNNVNLYTAGVTESLGVEAFVFVKEFTAYSQKPGTLFSLVKRWDAQMIYNQDTWQRTPELWGGISKRIDAAALAPYLQTNCWQKIGVFLDETGYFIKVNDVEVARSASTDITKWAGAGNVTVEVGSFDGWLDELAIRSNVKGFVPPPSTNSQTITFAALPTKTYGDAAFTLSATASSGLPVTFSSGNTSVATVSGNTVTIVGAGTVFITASQAGNGSYSAATPVTQTLTVNKAAATVSLSGLSATFDGTAKSASATTSPGSLPVTMTYNGSSSAPVNAGSHAVVATINSANYTGTASGTLVIAKVNQTISFGALANKTFGDAPYALSATSSSGLPVSFGSGNSAVATVSGNQLTVVGAGSVFITASQAGNSNFNAAANVVRTLIVDKAAATVSLSGLSATYSGSAKIVTATTTPAGLPVTVTYNGGSSAPSAVGSYAVVATVNHPNYAGSASGTLTIAATGQAISFAALPVKVFGDAAFTLSATASSGLPVSYSSGNTSVATVSGNTVTIVGAGSATITASQAGNTDYSAATPVAQTLTVNKATATVSLSGLTATYDGAAKSASATTTPAGLPVTVTYNGGSSAPSAVGSYAVVATVNHPNYVGSASGTLVINKASASVTLAGLSAVYDGAPKPVSVSTTPAGLAVSVTYNGSSTAPANAGSYAVVATVNDASYAGSASGTLLITQPTNLTQTITFAALPTKTYGDAAFTLSATASSGLPVTFSSGNTSVATISGNTLTIVGAGTAVLTATQTGNATYNPATATQALTVNKAAATVSLSGLSATYDGAAKSASATTSPGSLPVTITYNGSSSAPVNAGNYAVIATISSANYTGSANGTLAIAKANQTINFGALANKTFGDAPSALSATSSSGLAVSFASGNPAVATVSGNLLTMVGAGSVFITASQAGNGNYNPATSVVQTLIVNKAAAAINFGGVGATYDGTAKSVTATTTPGGLPVTVTYNGSATAPVNAGSYAVVASVNTANYAGTNTATLNIAKAGQTINFGALANKTFGDAPSALSATSSSGLPVSFASGNTAAATVSGNQLTVVGAGSVFLTASQAGNSNYNAAANVVQTLIVEKAAATVTLGGLSATYDGTAKSVTATTTPGSLPVTVTYNGSSSAPSAAGSYTVVATVNHPNYAGGATGTLVISQPGKQTQTITFAALPARTYGDAASTLSATASSGLPVTFSSGNTSVATVSGNTLTIVGAGTAVITATQTGDATYNPATPVTQTLTVNKAAATVSLTGLSATFDGTAKSASATTSPGSLPVTMTYNGSSSAPVNAGSYAVVATINSANYTGSASGTLVIAKANQTVNFGALANKTFGDAPSALSATSSSGLPVSFGSGNTAVATVSGNLLTVVGGGSVFITASQAGNSNYNAAANVVRTLIVDKAAATVSLSGLSATYSGSAKIVTATTTPAGLPVTVTYNGGSSAPSAVGSYAVVATVNHPNYSGSASGTLVIVDAATPAVLTVVTEGLGSVSPNLDGQTFAPGTNLTLAAQPAVGWKLEAWLVDGNFAATNLTFSFTMNASVTVTARFVDAAAPSVAITSLSTNAGRGTAPSLTLSGTAVDNAGIASVEYAMVSGGVTSEFQAANGTTNWTCELPSPAYGTNLIRVRARDWQGNYSPVVTRVFNYVVRSPFSLTIAGKGSVSPSLNGQLLELGRTYTLSATASSGNAFDRWDGGVLSSNRILAFVMSEGLSLKAIFRETTAPAITIKTPGAGARFTNNFASFTGSASDSSGLERVEFSLNGAAFAPAIGTTNWTVAANLAAGTNVFRVRSLDKAGNFSAVASRSVFYIVTSPLQLTISGQGSISGATNGQRLEIGRAYKVTATPAKGNLFLEWSGDRSSMSNALTFLMQTNLHLQANFVTNPFVALQGNYTALFYESNQVQHQRSGLLKLTVSSSGSYSASLKQGTKSLSLTGKFNARGQSRLNAALFTGNVVGFDLLLDTEGYAEQLVGRVSGPGWTGDLNGYRTPIYAGAAPAATGRFTFVIPADDRSTNHPAGLGVGTMTVSSTGAGTLAGKLADGTAFTVGAPLSRGGYFPVYAQLYSSAGSVLSWLRFTNRAMSDFDGALSWIKPANSRNATYPAGFTVQTFCVGSTYNATNTPLLSLTNAPMEFSGGALGEGFANLVSFLPAGTLSNHSTNKLSFTLTKSSGLFSGTVVNPRTGGSLSYSGVVFPKWNAGLGYTLVGKQSSAVKLAETE